jgi:hypothetical protein
VLHCCRRQAQPLRHLSPPTARAPPAMAQGVFTHW